MKLPVSKTNDVVVQETGDELLIYNLATNRAFALNETSTVVYRACDGETNFEELKRRTNFTDDLVYLALDELKRHDLITGYEPRRHFKGLTRREAVRRVGLASIIALPVISSIVSPAAVNAQSVGCANRGLPNDQGTCPSGQRCIGAACVPCAPMGQIAADGCIACCSSTCFLGVCT